MSDKNTPVRSGIVSYIIGTDRITLKFVNGAVYEYIKGTNGVKGKNLRKMIKLAKAGKGLMSYINTHPNVRIGYSAIDPLLFTEY